MNINIIEQIESKYMRKRLLLFRPGDSVSVKIWVVEGDKKRLQIFDGIVIAIRRRGLNSTFTVRKHSYGEGVERVFNIYSPIIDNIVINRCGKVRQAKLYYLRRCSGKNARIKERM